MLTASHPKEVSMFQPNPPHTLQAGALRSAVSMAPATPLRASGVGSVRPRALGWQAAVLSMLACLPAMAQAGSVGGHAHKVAVPVLEVRPQMEKVRVTRSQCDRVVEHSVHSARRPDPAAPVVGALFGGLLGSQLGDPGHRTAAATVGVIIGAVAGDALSRADGHGAGHVHRGHVCREVVHWEHRPSGFLVTYAYGGRTQVIVMPHHPGATLWLDVVVQPRLHPTPHGHRGPHERFRGRGPDGDRHGWGRGGRDRDDGWRDRGRPGWGPG
jgi:uncharacterized protein YcfJ